MRKRWLRPVVVPVALAFVAAACGPEDDDDDVRPPRPRGPAHRRDPDGTGRPDREHRGAAAHWRRPKAPRPPRDGTEASPDGARHGRWRADMAGAEITVSGPSARTKEAGALQDALGRLGRGARPGDHLRRRMRLRGEDRYARCRRQPARHRHLPAARQPRATSPRAATWFALRDDVDGDGVGELARILAGVLGRRRGHAVRRAGEGRPEVARLVQPAGLRPIRATRSPRRTTSSSP